MFLCFPSKSHLSLERTPVSDIKYICAFNVGVVCLSSCNSFHSSVPKNYQHILALAFAVKEINENLQILPNISVGFHILNSYYTAKMTYKATLGLLSTQSRFVPNFRCNNPNKLIALIGEHISEISSNMAVLSTSHKVPQVCSMHGIFMSLEKRCKGAILSCILSISLHYRLCSDKMHQQGKRGGL